MADSEAQQEQRAFHNEGGTIIFDKPSSDEKTAEKRRQDEEHEYARDQVKSNRLIAYFNGLLVIATFTGIVIGIWQAYISRAAVNTARASIIQAQQALQTTIDNFHQEQRAWIGIAATNPLSYSTDPSTRSASMTVAFTLENYGHSAAEHVHFLAVLESDPTVNSIPCSDAAKLHGGDILLPTQTRTLNWVMTLKRDQMEKGWNHQNPQLGNTLLLKILGCIEYSDREGEKPPHFTPFSYLVYRKDAYISAQTRNVPGRQLGLSLYGVDSSETR